MASIAIGNNVSNRFDQRLSSAFKWAEGYLSPLSRSTYTITHLSSDNREMTVTRAPDYQRSFLATVVKIITYFATCLILPTIALAIQTYYRNSVYTITWKDITNETAPTSPTEPTPPVNTPPVEPTSPIKDSSSELNSPKPPETPPSEDPAAEPTKSNPLLTATTSSALDSSTSSATTSSALFSSTSSATTSSALDSSTFTTTVSTPGDSISVPAQIAAATTANNAAKNALSSNGNIPRVETATPQDDSKQKESSTSITESRGSRTPSPSSTSSSPSSAVKSPIKTDLSMFSENLKDALLSVVKSVINGTTFEHTLCTLRPEEKEILASDKLLNDASEALTKTSKGYCKNNNLAYKKSTRAKSRDAFLNILKPVIEQLQASSNLASFSGDASPESKEDSKTHMNRSEEHKS